jgi:hypothetical protein
MNIFHDPTGPSSSGSPVAQALLAKDPEVAVSKFTSESGNRGIADLRRYSPSLANLAQDVRQSAQEQIKVPARSSVADIKPPKISPVPAGPNLPLPPALPGPPAEIPFRQPKLTSARTISVADLQRANETAVQRSAQGVVGHLLRLTAVWPAFRMLSELTRTGETSLKPLAVLPAAGAAGMTAESILAQPAVMDFLTRATRSQIAQIPPELRGDMPRIVSAARAKGIPVSPILAAYATTIQRNQNGSQQSQPAQPQPQPQSTPTLQGASQ